jgi:hypothetical protein
MALGELIGERNKEKGEGPLPTLPDSCSGVSLARLVADAVPDRITRESSLGRFPTDDIKRAYLPYGLMQALTP